MRHFVLVLASARVKFPPKAKLKPSPATTASAPLPRGIMHGNAPVVNGDPILLGILRHLPSTEEGRGRGRGGRRALGVQSMSTESGAQIAEH